MLAPDRPERGSDDPVRLVVGALVALYGPELVLAAAAEHAPLAASAPPPGDMGAVYLPHTQLALPFETVAPPA